jgi:hypothetical protein
MPNGDCTMQDAINQQQEAVNQQLLEQMRHMHARMNEVYTWIVNHEQTHTAEPMSLL